MSKELITQVRGKLIKLAELQRPDLTDTSEFSNFNTALSQVVKIRILLNKDSDPAKILPIVVSLQKDSLAELESELPKMVSEEHLQKAKDLHQEITKDISVLQGELEQSLKEVPQEGLNCA